MKKRHFAVMGLLAAALLAPGLSLAGCGGGDPAENFRFKVNESGGATITEYVGKSQTVKIPAKLDGKPITEIGEEAFKGKELNSVTIPNSVTNIEWMAFAENQLTSVTIPNSVTNIGWRAFRKNQLTSVTIGEEDAFGYDTSFTTLYEGNGKQAGTYTRPTADSTKWVKQ